jgi:hypothetical protein
VVCGKWPRGWSPPSGRQYSCIVGGWKPLIAQPNDLTCWAATYAMMRSWREGKTFEIAEALEKPGKVRDEPGPAAPAGRSRITGSACGRMAEGIQAFPSCVRAASTSPSTRVAAA